jgi:ATPase subunit of ABC transporter with duplicated ATPase domains
LLRELGVCRSSCEKRREEKRRDEKRREEKRRAETRSEATWVMWEGRYALP